MRTRPTYIKGGSAATDGAEREGGIAIVDVGAYYWGNVPAFANGGLTRQTSAQQVASHIRQMILTKRLNAGERVPQDDIAAELNLSRVPVREAVIALASEGWLTAEPHRGAFVNGIDENFANDSYELLGMIYGYAARRASERGSDADIVRLAELNAELQRVDDPDRFLEANSAYLQQLLQMAASRRIMALARFMATTMFSGNYFTDVPGVMPLHKRGLRAITKAIQSRAAETAEREFTFMMRSQAVNVIELFSERGLIAE